MPNLIIINQMVAGLFDFSKRRLSAILDFQIRKFLMPYLVHRAQMHYLCLKDMVSNPG